MLRAAGRARDGREASRRAEATGGRRGGVGCAASHLRPVMKRSRGRSSCVCVDEQKALAEEADEYVYVRFSNCTEEGRCWGDDADIGVQ